MTIVITFLTRDISGNSCKFNDGSGNTYTISNIEASQTSEYKAGRYVSWSYDGEVQNSSGTVFLSNQNCGVTFAAVIESQDDIQYTINYANFNSSFGELAQIYSNVGGIKLLDGSGNTSIPLFGLTSSEAPFDFSNNTIMPNSITSPSEWNFGPESDYADISGNNAFSTTCTMTFYSSSNTNNIQDVGIAGTAAGIHELINQRGPQTLNSQYIASMALLWYSWYGIYG